MDLTEKTVNKNYVYKGKIISVRCDDALRADGKPCKREIVEHPGGAAVLYVEDGKVLLVKQYRYAFKKEMLEIPAGKLNYGEDPALSAKRELSEEAGVEAVEMKHLYSVIPTCGYSSEIIYIYEATKVVKGDAHLDEGEFLNVEYMPIKEVWQKILSGEIDDGKTVLAVQRYLLEHREIVL